MSLGKIIDTENNNLSMKIDKQKIPEHVAIIMDGNGRWATKKGLPRTYGHKKGVSVLKEILKASKKLGCKILTVYAFSTENWARPTKEVDFLINLFTEVLRNEIREIHVSILGNQIGFFYTEFGELNKVVHLYGYDSYDDRDKRRAILAKNKDFISRLLKWKIKKNIQNLKVFILFVKRIIFYFLRFCQI